MADANDAGRAAMRTMIDRLNSIGGMVERSAPRVAQAVEREVVRDTKAQRGPDDEPWKPTETGKPALQHVEKALSARAVGTVIMLRLEGHYARHHVGAVRGGVRRAILPTRSVPEPMTRAISGVLEDEFVRTMGGRR